HQVRVGRRGRRRRHVRVRPEIAGRVLRAHDVAVAGRHAERGVAEARAGDQEAEFREYRAANTLTALETIADNADVVGRGTPRDVDLRPADRDGRERTGRRGVLRVGRDDSRDVGGDIVGGVDLA